MATSSSNDPSTYSAGTTPTGSEQVLANQSGSLVSLTTAQLTQLSYNSLALWKTYDTVAQMKAGASAAYPRVKWRGYNYVGDGGGGEGLYVVPDSSTTYTADEGTIFSTTAGGYVLRDIPSGDVKTPWFGMTYPSGAPGTAFNPTTIGQDYNPTKDFSAALQNASNFAASLGRALHIVGRLGTYRLASTVTFNGVRKIFGDGPVLDSKFGTSLNWQPATTTDLAAGIVLPDEAQELLDISVITTDANWPSTVTSANLITGGQLTVPNGFVWHTSVLPYTAFSAGLVGIAVNNKCVLRNVVTQYGKFGVTCNTSTGHITFDTCSVQGGCAGRFWIQDGQDHFIIGGGASGHFCSELMSENNFSGTVIRYHQYHTPIGWYQCNYFNTGYYYGMYLNANMLSIEALSESWVYIAPTAVGTLIETIAGADYYAYPVGSSDYELSNKLPDALFASSKRNMYSCGRFGGVGQFKLGALGVAEIVPTGGSGTYSAAFSGFPQVMDGSDFSIFRLSNIDLSTLTGNSPYAANVEWLRNMQTLADRSDPAVKTLLPQTGNIAAGTNAYSVSMGLGVTGNCLLANGGGWSLYYSNSAYPASAKIDTCQNWLAAGVSLVIPENVSRMVGANPLIIEVTNTGTTSNPSYTSLYIRPSINNVADGQQGLYFSVYTAGLCGPYVKSSAQTEYLATSIGVTGGLTFQATIYSGKVLAKGVAVSEVGVNCTAMGAKVYIIAPMVNFGSLVEYNPHQHPAAQAPIYLASGLRQAGRAFVTTTASGGATTAVTIADFLLEVNATAAAATVTLPAAPFDGEVHVIKKADTSANAVTVGGNGLLIDGASTYVLPGSARGSVRLQYVGSAATPHWCVM